MSSTRERDRGGESADMPKWVGQAHLIERRGHYGRTSSDLQADRGTIEARKHHLDRQAERDGYAPVLQQWDAGSSGTIPFHERPRSTSHHPSGPGGLDTLYVNAWDRLRRDAAEGIAVARQLESLGVAVVSATQGRADTAAGGFNATSISSSLSMAASKSWKPHVTASCGPLVTVNGVEGSHTAGQCGTILVHRDVDVVRGGPSLTRFVNCTAALHSLKRRSPAKPSR